MQLNISHNSSRRGNRHTPIGRRHRTARSGATVFAIIAVVTMLMVTYVPLAESDAGPQERIQNTPVPRGTEYGFEPFKDYYYRITTDNAGTSITKVEYSTDGSSWTTLKTMGTTSGGQATKLRDYNSTDLSSVLKFDKKTGLGPFNSFYAAVYTGTGNMLMQDHVMYVLDPYDLSKHIDGSALLDRQRYEIMLFIPTVYWSTSDNVLVMSNQPGGTRQPYAHTDIEDEGRVGTYLGIGVYEGSSAAYRDSTEVGTSFMRSVAGMSSAANAKNTWVTQAGNCNDYAVIQDSSNTPGRYMLWNYQQYTLYKMMMYTIMGTKNTHVIMGKPVGEQTNGSQDTAGPVGGMDTGKMLLEGIYGGKAEYIDGARMHNDGIYIDYWDYNNSKKETSYHNYNYGGASPGLKKITEMKKDATVWDAPGRAVWFSQELNNFREIGQGPVGDVVKTISESANNGVSLPDFNPRYTSGNYSFYGSGIAGIQQTGSAISGRLAFLQKDLEIMINPPSGADVKFVTLESSPRTIDKYSFGSDEELVKLINRFEGSMLYWQSREFHGGTFQHEVNPIQTLLRAWGTSASLTYSKIVVEAGGSSIFPSNYLSSDACKSLQKAGLQLSMVTNQKIEITVSSSGMNHSVKVDLPPLQQTKTVRFIVPYGDTSWDDRMLLNISGAVDVTYEDDDGRRYYSCTTTTGSELTVTPTVIKMESEDVVTDARILRVNGKNLPYANLESLSGDRPIFRTGPISESSWFEFDCWKVRTIEIYNVPGGTVELTASGGNPIVDGSTIAVSTRKCSDGLVPAQSGGKWYINCNSAPNNQLILNDAEQQYVFTITPDTGYRLNEVVCKETNPRYPTWGWDKCSKYGLNYMFYQAQVRVSGDFLPAWEVTIDFDGNPPFVGYSGSEFVGSADPYITEKAALLVGNGEDLRLSAIPSENRIARFVHTPSGGTATPVYNIGNTDDTKYTITNITKAHTVVFSEIPYFEIAVSTSEDGGTSAIACTTGYPAIVVGSGESAGTSFIRVPQADAAWSIADYESTETTYANYHLIRDNVMTITENGQTYTITTAPTQNSTGKVWYRVDGFLVDGDVKQSTSTTAAGGTVTADTEVSGNFTKYRELSIAITGPSVTYKVTLPSAEASPVAIATGSKLMVDDGSNASFYVTPTGTDIARVQSTPNGGSMSEYNAVSPYAMEAIGNDYALNFIQRAPIYISVAAPVLGASLTATCEEGIGLISGDSARTITVVDGATWEIDTPSTDTSYHNEVNLNQSNRLIITDGAQVYYVKYVAGPTTDGTGHRIIGFLDKTGTTPAAMPATGTISANKSIDWSPVKYHLVSVSFEGATIAYSVVSPAYAEADVTGTDPIQILVDDGSSSTYSAMPTTAGRLVRVVDTPFGGTEGQPWNVGDGTAVGKYTLTGIAVAHELSFQSITPVDVSISIEDDEGQITVECTDGNGSTETVSGTTTVHVGPGAVWCIQDSESEEETYLNYHLMLDRVMIVTDGAQSYRITITPTAVSDGTGYRSDGFLVNGEEKKSSPESEATGDFNVNMPIKGNYIKFHEVTVTFASGGMTYKVAMPSEDASFKSIATTQKVMIDDGSSAQFCAVPGTAGNIMRLSDNGGLSVNIGDGGRVGAYQLTDVTARHDLAISEITPAVIIIDNTDDSIDVDSDDGGNPDETEEDDQIIINVDPTGAGAQWAVSTEATGADLLLKRHEVLTITDGAQVYTIRASSAVSDEYGLRAYGFRISGDLKLSADNGSFTSAENISIASNKIPYVEAQVTLDDISLVFSTSPNGEATDDNFGSYSGTIGKVGDVMTQTVTITDTRIPAESRTFTVPLVSDYHPVYVDLGFDVLFTASGAVEETVIRVIDTPAGGEPGLPTNVGAGYPIKAMDVSHLLNFILEDTVQIVITVQDGGSIDVVGFSTFNVPGTTDPGIINVVSGTTWEIIENKMVITDGADVYTLTALPLTEQKYFHSFTSDGTEALDDEGTVEGGMTIEGRFDDTHTVTYEMGKGTGGTLPVDPVWYIPGETVVILDKTEDMTGPGKFTGWKYSIDGLVYTPGQTVDMPAVHITFTAVWTPTYVTISFDANGGDGNMEDQIIPYDTDAAINKCLFTMEGFALRQWYDGENHVSYPDQGIINIPQSSGISKIVLSAVWGQAYALAFEVNGGSKEAPVTTYHLAEETIKLERYKGQISGYLFAGWQSDYDNAIYKNGGSFVMPAADVILRAVWKVDPDAFNDDDDEIIRHIIHNGNDSRYTDGGIFGDGGVFGASIYLWIVIAAAATAAAVACVALFWTKRRKDKGDGGADSLNPFRFILEID